MARPKKEINPVEVEKLASLMCTQEEIAAFFDVNVSTISRRFAKEIEKGREVGKMSIRRKQFKLAEKNASMAIFLGKNYLGQSDTQEFIIEDVDQYFSQIIDAITKLDTHTG